LGHPSNKFLECLAKNYSDIRYDKRIICIPYHLVKQHKLPFILSKTNSLSVFYLDQLDIWAPFGTPFVHGHKVFLTMTLLGIVGFI